MHKLSFREANLFSVDGQDDMAADRISVRVTGEGVESPTPAAFKGLQAQEKAGRVSFAGFRLTWIGADGRRREYNF